MVCGTLNQPDSCTNPSAAIELLPIPVAKAPSAPYIGVCESQPTTIMPGRDEARLHDDVVNAAAAAVEQVADLVTCGELAHRRERFGGLARRGREVMIESEHDLVGIGDARARHLVFEHLHHEVRAQIVHQHQVDTGDDDLVGLDLGFAALAGEYFLHNVHSCRQPSGPWMPVSP